jgi:hypothetical protein
MNLIENNGVYEMCYSYDEALELGLKQYSGRPCRHGHGTMRFMANKDCVKCRAIIKNKARVKYAQKRKLNKPKPKSYTPPGLSDKEQWAYRAVRSPSRKALHVEDIIPLLVDVCPILEISLNYSNVGVGHTAPYNHASLDKIDPSKGYVVGNLQVISKKANAMKNNATVEELRKFVKNITTRLL